MFEQTVNRVSTAKMIINRPPRPGDKYLTTISVLGCKMGAYFLDLNHAIEQRLI